MQAMHFIHSIICIHKISLIQDDTLQFCILMLLANYNVCIYVTMIITFLDNIIVMLYTIFTNRNQSSDRLADITCCREPFLEVMNEIEDM